MARPCPITWEVNVGDTCDEISRCYNVLTFELEYANKLNCNRFPDNGTRLYIPDSQCKFHQVAHNDTCDSIKTYNGLTGTNLLAW